MVRRRHRKHQRNGTVTVSDRIVIGGVLIDKRSRQARLFQALEDSLHADLGGIETLTTAQLQAVRRVASLSVQIETMERGIAEGAVIDTNEYVRLVNCFNRSLQMIGMERRAKDITPKGAGLDDHTRAVIDAEAIDVVDDE